MFSKKSFLLIFLVLILPQALSATVINYFPVDSIMKRVNKEAERFEKIVEEYESEVYMRSYVQTLKKNKLYPLTKFIPRFVLHDSKSQTAIIESVSSLTYKYPNEYTQNIKNVTGTIARREDIEMLPFHFININIYGETSGDERFIMPLRKSSQKFYNYRLKHTSNVDGKENYFIEFSPILEAPRLLRGSFIIEKDTWRVLELNCEGLDFFSTFSLKIVMGNNDISAYLPLEYYIHMNVSYLGNIIASRYLASIKYKSIEKRKERDKEKRNLNISNRYKVRLESVPLLTDTLYWEQRRAFPLQEIEKEAYKLFAEKEEKKRTIESAKLDSALQAANNLKDVAKAVVMDTKYSYKSTSIKYGGLLNPALFDISPRDGISYAQKFRAGIQLDKGKDIVFNAKAEYYFRLNELYFDFSNNWNYNPKKRGVLSLYGGKNSRKFSNRRLNRILNNPDFHSQTFDKLKVGSYHSYFVGLQNNIEITNGLEIKIGVEYRTRDVNNLLLYPKNELTPQVKPSLNDAPNIERIHIKSFTPQISISWTPEQYYRYDGVKKIYVYSPYPTFKIDYSKSISGVFNSDSETDKIEIDISQNIPFGQFQSIQYHVAGGLFFNQKTNYFSDFIYFSRRNKPSNWNDDIGGRFNVMSRVYYNATPHYIQGHVMYEAPFMILSKIPYISRSIMKERLYLGTLYTPLLKCYSEFGYGFGTKYFNLGVFVAFDKTEFTDIGVQATFPLF